MTPEEGFLQSASGVKSVLELHLSPEMAHVTQANARLRTSRLFNADFIWALPVPTLWMIAMKGIS